MQNISHPIKSGKKSGFWSTLKMEAICSSEMLVITYKTIWHLNPEENPIFSAVKISNLKKANNSMVLMMKLIYRNFMVLWVTCSIL
jgi:hypothetical protein